MQIIAQVHALVHVVLHALVHVVLTVAVHVVITVATIVHHVQLHVDRGVEIIVMEDAREHAREHVERVVFLNQLRLTLQLTELKLAHQAHQQEVTLQLLDRPKNSILVPFGKR